MSHFYGTLKGNRGEATRCGNKASGLTTYAAGWNGAVTVTVYRSDDDTHDRARISLVPWQGSGGSYRLIADIELNATANTEAAYGDKS